MITGSRGIAFKERIHCFFNLLCLILEIVYLITEKIVSSRGLTAMMVTPVRLLMGVVPVWAGLVCLLLTAGLALLVTYLAGKVYSMMSLYKGNVPRINEMLKIIFSKA